MLEAILAYLIGLAAGFRADAISDKYNKKLIAANKKGNRELFAIQSVKDLKNRLSEIAGETNKILGELKLDPPLNTALDVLFSDDVFCDDLAVWLSYWEIKNSLDAKERLKKAMTDEFTKVNIAKEVMESFVSNFFNLADTIVFANPILSRWRHQLTINVLREEHKEIIRRLRERDGVFDKRRLEEASQSYREAALKNHDIVDLHGLPEDDRNLAMKNFVLRQLYIPMRVVAEPEQKNEENDSILVQWEEARKNRRLQAAGRNDNSEKEDSDERLALGEILTKNRRVVILADPGGGKTTLMRWFATAYLLRLKHDADFKKLPDVATLPKADWLPIMIRCRELPKEPDVCAIDSILDRHIDQLNVIGPLKKAIRVLFLDSLEKGNALLIFDGLDEIQDPMMRARFCRRLESLAALFENAPIIATSRIVGYREMPFHLGQGFRHTTITDLTREDMDQFAHQWAIATEPKMRQKETEDDLIQNIHSSDRVERLARNPMLLTVMALVHRKVGRLPQKRHELYREALKVLLNWRGEIDERLDWDEAVPQLEYVAYVMCREGVQQLPRDRVLELIEEMRGVYGQRLRDINNRSPQEFLKLLERRSSLLMESGRTQVEGHEIAVYEFQHLTFQEYLAALALVDGRFPEHEKKIRLPKRLAPLAGIIDTQENGKEFITSENWREPLRLCLAEANDDDVDDAMLAILHSDENEAPEKTAKARAVMAALCLADEPNISDEVAGEVLEVFVANIEKVDIAIHRRTALYVAASELARCVWVSNFYNELIRGFKERTTEYCLHPGSIYATIAVDQYLKDKVVDENFFIRQTERLAKEDENESIMAALIIMHLAFEGEALLVPGLVDSLIAMLERSKPSVCASVWALCWMSLGGPSRKAKSTWQPTEDEIDRLIKVCRRYQEEEILRFSFPILGKSKCLKAIDTLYGFLKNKDKFKHHAVDAFKDCLGDKNIDIRKGATLSLAKLHGLDDLHNKLLFPEGRSMSSCPDPKDPIGKKHLERAAKELNKTEAEIRAMYEKITPKFRLNLEWKKAVKKVAKKRVAKKKAVKKVAKKRVAKKKAVKKVAKKRAKKK